MINIYEYVTDFYFLNKINEENIFTTIIKSQSVWKYSKASRNLAKMTFWVQTERQERLWTENVFSHLKSWFIDLRKAILPFYLPESAVS